MISDTILRKELMDCKRKDLCYEKCSAYEGCRHVYYTNAKFSVCAENKSTQIEIILNKPPYDKKPYIDQKFYQVSDGDCEAFHVHVNKSLHQYAFETTLPHVMEENIIPENKRHHRYAILVKINLGDCHEDCNTGEIIL